MPKENPELIPLTRFILKSPICMTAIVYLQCPYCNKGNLNSTGLFAEPTGAKHLHMCDACGETAYIKKKIYPYVCYDADKKKKEDL